MGLYVNSDAVLQRVKQLIEKEDSSLAQITSTIYSLQRKVKQLKKELEGKELHLDMLRKKVATLEERRSEKLRFLKKAKRKMVKLESWSA